jgi:hypothetical protein
MTGGITRSFFGFAVAGATTGISYFLCTIIDRGQRDFIEVRRQVDAIAAGIRTREEKAQQDRKDIMDEVADHQRKAEQELKGITWGLRYLDGKLDKLGKAIEGVSKAGVKGTGGPIEVVPGVPTGGDAIEGGWPDEEPGLEEEMVLT